MFVARYVEISSLVKLVLLRRYPELYRSVSAFSPIVHPTESPWGQKAFSLYLGLEPSRATLFPVLYLRADGLR